ncbi:MAG TPA: amidohydrolase/deacetylase family metallohydrolase [Pseudomonadales bacterium]
MQRRHLIGAAMACAALPRSSTLFGAAPAYDLVLCGGRVIDPAQQIDMIGDVAVAGGRIAAVAPSLPADAAGETIAVSGRLVVPGLIDVHVHARDAELPPSDFLASGVTTMVDAGSRGADNIDTIVSIARAAPNRLRLLLNIAVLGNFPGGRAEFLDGLAPADVGKARAAVEEHREWIVGIKARLSRGVTGELDREVLRRAVEVAGSTNLPVMIHVGDTATPLPQLVRMLRPGDIVTHMYAPTPNGILDAGGRVLPEIVQARNDGIRFDFGNGLNEHWAWDVAEKALAQGFMPDTISSDLNVPGRTAQVFDLPNVLSKFLALGMPLDEVIARATRNAAQTFRELDALGSLRVGAPADITVLELAEGDFEFVDNYRGTRMGTQKLLPRGVVVGGARYRA